jgi:sugar phosphate permease
LIFILSIVTGQKWNVIGVWFFAGFIPTIICILEFKRRKKTPDEQQLERIKSSLEEYHSKATNIPRQLGCCRKEDK